MTRRLGIAISVCAAGAALGAAPAQATVVERSGSTITVEAARKQVNHIQFRVVSDDAVAFTDRRAGLTTEAEGCLQAGRALVRCDTEGVERIVIKTGDRADKIVIAEVAFPSFDVTADLGAGNDSARLGFKPADAENSTVGQVVVRGGSGNDSIGVAFKPADIENSTIGQITVDAGAGNDALAARAVLEADQPPVATIVQVVARMGAGNDRAALGLLGTTYGGTGADYLVGGDGAQTLYGEGGRDRIDGGAGGDDHCDGGDDADVYGPGCETTVLGIGDTGTHEVGHWPGRR